MSNRTFNVRARLAVVVAFATCALIFVPSANAAWLANPFTPNTTGQFGETSVTILPNQSFGFVYNKVNGINQIWDQSISLGGTATSPTVVNEPDGGGDNQVFAAPDGSRNITYRTNNGSNGFSYAHVSAADVIADPVATGVSPPGVTPTVVADSNGTITGLWPNGSNGFDYVRIGANGVGTPVSTLEAASPPINPGAAVDGKGNTFVAWSEVVAGTGAARVRVLKIDADGVISGPNTVATVGAGYNGAAPPVIAASPDGDLLIGVRALFIPPAMNARIFPWSVRVRAGESTGVATALPGYPDVINIKLYPTIGNGGRGTMFIVNYSSALSRDVLVARPIAASGTAGTEFPVSDDLGYGQSVVATADAGGTATVAWTDDGTTDTALVARLPIGTTTVTPMNLFPGRKSRDLELATTAYGDVAITAAVDYYTTPGARLQYWKNPPACEEASASTGAATTVNIPLKCASRDTIAAFNVQSPPLNGSVTITDEGAATYTPTAGFSGADTFTYTADNGNGRSPGSTVTVNVAAPAVIPTPPIVIKKSAKFPKGKIKANKKIKVTLTGVEPGKKLTIAWRLKKKTAKGGAISTANSYVTFKSPKKKGKYKVTVKLGTETLFSGTVKVS